MAISGYFIPCILDQWHINPDAQVKVRGTVRMYLTPPVCFNSHCMFMKFACPFSQKHHSLKGLLSWPAVGPERTWQFCHPFTLSFRECVIFVWVSSALCYASCAATHRWWPSWTQQTWQCPWGSAASWPPSPPRSAKVLTGQADICHQSTAILMPASGAEGGNIKRVLA